MSCNRGGTEWHAAEARRRGTVSIQLRTSDQRNCCTASWLQRPTSIAGLVEAAYIAAKVEERRSFSACRCSGERIIESCRAA
jgi:hypothetical protein